MKKVYISGPITGRTEKDYRTHFAIVEKILSDNYEVINPVTIGDSLTIPWGLTEKEKWELYMKADLKALATCDHIYMMEGWEHSKGALTELGKSLDFGISRIY